MNDNNGECNINPENSCETAECKESENVYINNFLTSNTEIDIDMISDSEIPDNAFTKSDSTNITLQAIYSHVNKIYCELSSKKDDISENFNKRLEII